MSLRIFLAELVGTFGLLVAATGSIVYNGRVGGLWGTGLEFIAAMHFVGLAAMVFVFGRYSMAHFNPMVTVGLWACGYTRTSKLPVYFAAQLAGAFAGSLAVLYLIGDHAGLGHNVPNYADYPVPAVYGIEVLASLFLMGAVMVVVARKSRPLAACVVIATVVALDVYFFGPVSGASMNPVRSLAPAVMVGEPSNLWLYLSAPFIAAAAVAAVFRKRYGHLCPPRGLGAGTLGKTE